MFEVDDRGECDEEVDEIGHEVALVAQLSEHLGSALGMTDICNFLTSSNLFNSLQLCM